MRRIRVNNVLAVYWDGLPDSFHPVRDVSLGGAYIETPVDWSSGSLIRLNLIAQQDHNKPRGPDIFRNLWSQVVRKTPDGFCVEFVFEDPTERKKLRRFLERSVCEAEARA